MVSSRQRTSALSDSVKTKRPLEEWTTREKLCLASLAIKYGNAWNSVARNMLALVDKDRPEGWLNQKTCAAQFEKLMNELGVDKRPKRNEPSDGNSSAVIYKKMREKREIELNDEITELRNKWLVTNNKLKALDGNQANNAEVIKPKTEKPEKPPTRAVTRRESSRQNLEKTLASLCKEASEYKNISLFSKPIQDLEVYNKTIVKHVDFETIKSRLGGEVEDPQEILSDLSLMFQNAMMFYHPEHTVYKAAEDLKDKMVPKWEKALLDRFKFKHP